MQNGRLQRCAAWCGSWRGWVVVLGLLLAGCLAVVVFGGADWRDAIETREARGRNARAVDLAMTYGWWAAVVNSAILVVLLGTVRWWARDTGGCGGGVTGGRVTKGFWIWVGLAVLMGAALRYPRMDLSLYNDEAYTLRRQVSGEFKQRESGFEFRKVLWAETIWANDIANNPMVFSVLSRASYQGWKKLSGGADGEVNEFWYRFPALVAGLLGIGAAAWFGLALGSTRVACLAAWLVAFHPWHVRYSTEARGYGLLLFLVPVMLVGFVYALRTGRWRWWVLFAVAQFLAAATFVGVLYFSVVLNGAAGCWLVWQWWKRRGGEEGDGEGEHAGGVAFSPGLLLGRLVVANVVSGILFLAVMLPHLVQIREALSGAVAHQGGGEIWGWWPDVLAYLGLGMPWFDAAPGSEINPAVMRIFRGEEGRTVMGAVLAAAILFGLGVGKIWGKGMAERCLVIGVTVTPIFYFLMTVAGGHALYRWHLVFLLPLVTVVIAYGVSRGKSGSDFKMTSGVVVRIVLALMVFGGYSIPLEKYVRNPKENPRALVEQARGEVYPGYLERDEQVVFAAFNCVGVYDPFVAITPSVALIREQMAKAEAEGKELYVMFARRPLVAGDVLELLENSGEFEPVGRTAALEESQYTNYLFKARDSGGE